MESTQEPQIIYDVFARHDLCVSRIDNFEKGNYAEIRIDLTYDSLLKPAELLELATRLKIIENVENIRIEIVHIDMRHKTLKLNIFTKDIDDNTQIREEIKEIG